jgi:hypothetical protein
MRFRTWEAPSLGPHEARPHPHHTRPFPRQHLAAKAAHFAGVLDGLRSQTDRPSHRGRGAHPRECQRRADMDSAVRPYRQALPNLSHLTSMVRKILPATFGLPAGCGPEAAAAGWLGAETGSRAEKEGRTRRCHLGPRRREWIETYRGRLNDHLTCLGR